MKYIFLDTCVLVNCTLVNATDSDPELMITIVDRMRDRAVKLLMPEVVKLEYTRKVPEELSLIKTQTKKFRGSVNTSVLPAPDVSKIHEILDNLDATRDAAVKRAQNYFLQVASDPELTVSIALDGDTVAEAVGYVLSGQKPSNGLGKGLLDPDSLTLASVARFARAQRLTGEDTLLICSDNHKDFAQWDSDRNAHVLAESIDERIPCAVRYYKSPRLLLEQELEITVEADQPLSNALDAYEQLSGMMSSIGHLAESQNYLKALSSSSFDLSMMDSIKRASVIDSGILDSIKRASVIDPGILDSIKRASVIDSGELQGQLSDIAPGQMDSTSNSIDLRKNEDGSKPSTPGAPDGKAGDK